MKDYSKLSDEALFEELDNLRTELEQETSMDGSGELGERIYKGFEPFFNAIYAEMDKRGLYEDDYSEVCLEDSNA